MLRSGMINGNVIWLVSRAATQCIHRSFYYRAMTIVVIRVLVKMLIKSLWKSHWWILNCHCKIYLLKLM